MDAAPALSTSPAFHTPALSWGPASSSDVSSLPSPPLDAPRRRQPTRASKSASRKSLEAAALADRDLSASPDPGASSSKPRVLPMSRPRNSSSASLDLGASLRLTRTGRPSKALKGQAVHACDQCGKVYTRAEHMRRHQRNHTQILKCDLDGCGKIFHRSDMLDRHQENHHRHARGSRTGSIVSQSDDYKSASSPALTSHARLSVSEHHSGYPSPMHPAMSAEQGTLEVGGMFTPLDTPVLGSSSLPSHDGSESGSFGASWGSQPGYESPMPVFTDAASSGFLQDGVPASDYSHFAYPPPPTSVGNDAWYPAYCEPEAPAPMANMGGFLPPAWRLAGEPPKTWNAPQNMFLDPTFEAMPPHLAASHKHGSEVAPLDMFDHERHFH